MTMSGDSNRSNLVDVTYQQLHNILSGHLEGASQEYVSDILKYRVNQLRNLSEPFGTPTDASKNRIESGAVTLRDGVVLKVEEADKTYVFAISKHFGIDEVEGLVLLRSFLYNEGLPSDTGSNSSTSLVDELLDAITPFYYAEKLFVLRCLIPLFRATAVPEGPLYEIANEWVPKIVPDGNDFAQTVITDYKGKLQRQFPTVFETQPKKASLWVKQNAREQLILLEVLFWTMWDNAACDGLLVELVYNTAYSTNLGSEQRNGALLMDAEGAQLGQDSAALWILLTIEVLELERVADPGGLEISDHPRDSDIYWASPDSLQRLHHLITTHQNSQFACLYLAWAFVLSRLARAASELKEIPKSYSKFFESLVAPADRSYQKDRQSLHVLMAHTCLQPEVGLFNLLLTLLTNSPFFVTAVAWRTGSTVTDPNAVAYRSVLKGLVVALVELVPVELIPDFDSLVEVWIALFGRSESKSVSGICRQFWQSDWSTGIARRAIFDVARSRFPIHCRPFLRLLRAMTAVGFLDTDMLSTADHGTEGEQLDEDRELCARHVFYHFQQLPTFTQVVPTSACTGAHALYEKIPERYTSSSLATPLTYSNLHPIKLPGGSVLPPRSIGRLLNVDGGEMVVIAWTHEHSGWKVILEILTDYVNRRRLYSGSSYHDVSFGRKKEQHTALSLKEIGVEMDDAGDELIVVDSLDLIRSVIQDNPVMAEALLEVLEAGDSVVSHTTSESSSPDLVQLTTTILEEALSRSGSQQGDHPRTSLITSSLSVLTALLALPKYSNRVWLYIRSTASLFGSEKNVGTTSVVLAAERLTGHYTMTLALLHLVQQLFNEASSSVLTVLQHTPKLQQVKEEVLLRATRFVHSEIWIEHVGWKYAQVGDRFEIGKRVAKFYAAVLKHASPLLPDVPLANLSQAVTDALLHVSTMSAVHPIVSSITGGSSMLEHLLTSRRYGDARRLIYLLESNIILTRTLLQCKQQSPLSSKPCLLEEALCSRGISGNTSVNPHSQKADPLDALVAFTKERGMGTIVPQEATRVLFSLCGCLAGLEGPPLTIVGHLSDPEAVVSSFVRIILHPYDDALLRNAVWNFITLAVDKEPALANLFIAGHFHIPSVKGKEKDRIADAASKNVTAFAVARDMLEQWNELWELNPQLLASLMRFLDVVWEHGHEHQSTLEDICDNKEFWNAIAGIIKEELGPVPDFKTENFVEYDGVQHSNLHEAISSHAYRTVIKAHAVRIVSMDVNMSLQAQEKSNTTNKPTSYITIQSIFRAEDQFADLLWEGASRTYEPALHDDLLEHVQKHFPTLTLKHVQVQEPVVERVFGDDFAFSLATLHQRLQPFLGSLGNEVDEALRMLSSINLNLSLAHAQTTLTQAWQRLMSQVTPLLRKEQAVRTTLVSIAAGISEDIAGEKRSGDLVSAIHHSRLSLLLALLESAWFSSSDKGKEVQDFIFLVQHVRGIIQNNTQSPAKSFLGRVSTPFHKVVLQIVYYCARQGTSLVRRPKTLNADQRLAISFMVEAALVLTIDALRVSFDAARVKLDLDVNEDLELLVAVFELCTRLDLNPSPSFWLTRCQETDVIRSSLDLFGNMDLVGLSDLSILRLRKRPLYGRQVLAFHTALAGITTAAERLASESILAAYSENPLSAAIKAGAIDVVLPELPGDRSPAHEAYCTMLAVVAAVANSLGRFGHYFNIEVCGLVQLYGDQIHRALSWTISDPLTVPLLDEIEQTIAVFSAVAQCSPAADRNDAAKRALNFFASNALLLLQQVNYALTHPNHLASTFEPVTAAQKASFEKDSQSAVALSSQTDMIDPMRRPLLTRLLHRMFGIASSIIVALISVCGAENVLTDDTEAWPRDQILIVPHSKVVLGEPTSIGTLLELGNCCLDVLRHLVDRPPMQVITSRNGYDEDDVLDVRESGDTIRGTLEATLFYAVTQLAMWLSKPEFDGTAKEVEDDPMMLGETETTKERDRKTKRQSLTMAERLRRGMTGEMASDVQALLNRAKPVIAKGSTVSSTKSVDLTSVLSRFVQEKIVVPS